MKPQTFDSHSEAQRSHWQTLKNLSKHLWPSDRKDLRFRVFVAVICLIGAKLLNVYVPFLLKESIDQLSLEKALIAAPTALIFSYGLARFMVQVLNELRDLFFIKVSQHAQRTIALNTFHHLHELSLDFHLSRQTGGLSRVIERGTRGIQFLLSFMTFNILPTLLEIVLVSVVISYHFNLTYAAIVFFTILGYIVLTLVVTEWRLKFRRTMNQAESKANTKAIDSLLNYETVKYFSNEEHEFQRFDFSLKKYEAAAIKSQYSLSLLNISQGLIISIGLIAVMSLAGYGVADGRLTVGDFVLINSFLIQLYMPLNFLGFVYREIKQSLIDMDKMFELLEIHSSIKDDDNAQSLKIQNSTVRFEGVHFSYNEDREILKGISFEVGQGKTTAIVGPSGSGKSTIFRLLFRFYDTNSGHIFIDGKNIKEVTQKSLRQSIGVVPQDTVLFNDTIGYNIQYGKSGADNKQVTEAATMAHIHQFIESLPQKYESEVGERGLKLSGGEKQRVAIARTILKNPEILIFDEATSALDSHTEKEIQKSLKEVSRNKTTLVIAHRLSTVIDADEILVLKNGLIVEKGRHEELLAKKGEYASMWLEQQQQEKSLSPTD